MIKNLDSLFNGRKRLFLIYGALNFLITNFVLHLTLFILPIIFSSALSSITNILIGFYLYGKKVFKVEKFSKKLFQYYFFLSFFSWGINFLFIKLMSEFGIQKNLAAIIMIPILTIISYLTLNKFIFSNKNS